MNRMRFKAYHGVLEQERIVGNDYILTLRMGYPLRKAVESDQVEDTLNYAEVYDLVKKEMEQPSALLEHVAGRIIDVLERTYSKMTSIDLVLTKCNPPIGGDGEGATVELHCRC